MSLRSESSARPAITTATASLARVRRGSLAALVLLLVQYGIGMPPPGRDRLVGARAARAGLRRSGRNQLHQQRRRR
jgi:hypothetical protein